MKNYSHVAAAGIDINLDFINAFRSWQPLKSFLSSGWRLINVANTSQKKEPIIGEQAVITMMTKLFMMTSSNGKNFRVTGHLCGNSPYQGQWRGGLMFSLICAWVNGWVNNRDAGDLRRHRTHYAVTVMSPVRGGWGVGGGGVGCVGVGWGGVSRDTVLKIGNDVIWDNILWRRWLTTMSEFSSLYTRIGGRHYRKIISEIMALINIYSQVCGILSFMCNFNGGLAV